MISRISAWGDDENTAGHRDIVRQASPACTFSIGPLRNANATSALASRGGVARCSTADTDQQAARQTRERMLQELSGRPVLVIGTHFAGATAGRIIRDGDAYRLDV